ncbi:hypothetical protein D3C72_1417820 [compost metagenome]
MQQQRRILQQQALARLRPAQPGRLEPRLPRIALAAQQRQALHVLGTLGQASAVEAGAADREEDVVHQLLDIQAGIVAAAHAQRDIDFLAGKVDQGVGRQQFDIQLRMLLDKTADARRQPARGERRHGTDGQALVAVAGLQHARGIGDLQQRVAHALGIDAAGRRQRDALAVALEQRHAQFVFQRADLVADRAVRDKQLRGRARKALVPRRGLEGAQGGQRGQARQFAMPAARQVLFPGAFPGHGGLPDLWGM